ncbi:MAG: histidine kinase dimerization/phospho-acceptor domain-containing protein, partial [Paraclostridium sp.]
KSKLLIYLFTICHISNLFMKNENLYFSSYILNIYTSINLIISISRKSIYKISKKENEVDVELKNIDLNMKSKLEMLKKNEKMRQVILKRLSNKKQLLETILNQNSKCVLIIDKDGYISNEDDSFTNLWSEYREYKYKIKLSYFLENSIKNKIDVLLDIQKVYDLGIEVQGEIISNDDRYFECNYAPFKINGQNIGVVCIITDITYKKQSQQQIDENQTKYKKIVETIPYNILLTDSEKVIYTNNRDENINIYEDTLKDLIIDNKKNGEFSYLCKEGEEKNIVINKTSFLENNEISNIVVLRDITEYTQLLERIKSSRMKYQSLVDIIPEGVYMCNMKDKKCVYANEKLLEIIGANNLNDIYNSDIENKISLSLSNCSDSAKFIRYKIKTNYGKEVYVELASITMEINNTLKGIGIIRDITEQVKIENIEKEIRRKKIEYMQKNDFFVNMSHELKTPLNLITSTNQLVQSVHRKEIEENKNGELARVTNIVKKQGHISLGLIENIMTLTKLESDFYESSLDYYNIVSVIEDIVIELNKYVKNNGIELIFDTYTEEKVINIDPHDIEKILLAVFSKIIKESKENSVVYIYINDLGDDLNVFIENKGGYYKNNSLSKRSKQSIDMNIEVAKSLIKLYNGKINILESENNVTIEINMKVNSKIDYYTKKNRMINSESIYAEYARINAL